MALARLLRWLGPSWLLGSSVLVAGSAEADTPPAAAAGPTPVEVDAATRDARRHFKTGSRLYRDGNYGGALAEFEEAYRLKPGPGSLQNMALCQKALFRYAEAADSLAHLLEKHVAELNDGERRAVDDALSELRSLMASIRLRVRPESARVLLDGRTLTPADWAEPIVLNVGEHALSAEAPGFATERRTIRVAGGQRELPQVVELRCVAGFVDITSNDPGANISIDGVPKARRAYRGPVEPETDHLLQVYREGVEPFEQTFRVGLCKTLAIRAQLEASEAASPADPTGPATAVNAAAQAPVGFFGQLSLDVLGLSRQPLSLDLSKARGGALAALGVRAGYRLSNPVALDWMLDVGALEVVGATDPRNVTVTRDYSLRSIHFGPNLNLMTTGDKLRFVTTIGAGVVHHRLAVQGNQGFRAAEAGGLDPYFRLELQLGFSFKHFLGSIGLVALIDGSTALQRGFTDSQSEGLTRDLGTTLPMVGLGLRGGFSQWRTGR